MSYGELSMIVRSQQLLIYWILIYGVILFDLFHHLNDCIFRVDA